jgi:hypothetical protein
MRAARSFVCEDHGDTRRCSGISKFDRTGSSSRKRTDAGMVPVSSSSRTHSRAIPRAGFRRGSLEQPHPDLRPGTESAGYGWEQYSRISGLWIRKTTCSTRPTPSRPIVKRRVTRAWKRGIRIGSVQRGAAGKIPVLHPRPNDGDDAHLAAEGVAVDAAVTFMARKWGPRP